MGHFLNQKLFHLGIIQISILFTYIIFNKTDEELVASFLLHYLSKAKYFKTFLIVIEKSALDKSYSCCVAGYLGLENICESFLQPLCRTSCLIA